MGKTDWLQRDDIRDSRKIGTSDCMVCKDFRSMRGRFGNAFGDSIEADKWPHTEPCMSTRSVIEGCLVSTVFLHIDHGFGGPPMWYETMVFSGDNNDELDQYTRRYSTKDEAIAGHEEVCALVQQIEKREV